MGIFAEWQPQYAEVAVASFPVIDKRPAIKNYLRIGLPYSRELATKFADASAFGIPLSRRRSPCSTWTRPTRMCLQMP